MAKELVVRWGDNADYEYTTLSAVKEHLEEIRDFHHVDLLIEKVEAGIRVRPVFTGNNYVSLFWQDSIKAEEQREDYLYDSDLTEEDLKSLLSRGIALA